jgi:hypothetical protein
MTLISEKHPTAILKVLVHFYREDGDSILLCSNAHSLPDYTMAHADDSNLQTIHHKKLRFL